jgi:hypothetical protein
VTFKFNIAGWTNQAWGCELWFTDGCSVEVETRTLDDEGCGTQGGRPPRKAAATCGVLAAALGEIQGALILQEL